MFRRNLKDTNRSRVVNPNEKPDDAASISEYWRRKGKSTEDKRPGRTFERSDGSLGCAECCNGDRCDDPSHCARQACPYCLGTGTNATVRLGTPISELSGRPGHPGFSKFTQIAESWGYG